MKKIGIVGGVSWLSTAEYYKTICLLSRQHHLERGFEGPAPVPEISIESVNINKSFHLRGAPGDEASWRGFDAYFHDALRRVECAGADFAIIASNTPHNRFEAITRGIAIPVISIFDVVARQCASHGAKRALILGTAPTMASAVFAATLEKHGIAGFVPQSDQDKAIVIELIDEIYAGRGNDAAERIRAVVARSFSSSADGSKVVCLSCTELPLAFPEFVDRPSFEADGILYLNTGVIHAQAAFDCAVSK